MCPSIHTVQLTMRIFWQSYIQQASVVLNLEHKLYSLYSTRFYTPTNYFWGLSFLLLKVYNTFMSQPSSYHHLYPQYLHCYTSWIKENHYHNTAHSSTLFYHNLLISLTIPLNCNRPWYILLICYRPINLLHHTCSNIWYLKQEK